MALAWPNLRKPLEQSSLSQSAALIREMFDECRYQATLRGEMTLVRLQRNSNRLQMGTWETLLSEQLQATQPSTTEPSENSGNSNTDTSLRSTSKAPFTLLAELPDGIVIQSVVFGISPISNPSSEIDNPSEPTTNSPIGETVTSDNLNESTAASSTDYWYVPFLPSGQSKDVSVILHDTRTGKQVMLQHHQGNGLTDIHKLPDVQPDGVGSYEDSSSSRDIVSPEEPL